jgi:spore coat polysaccharide biosynthesis protein SpsF
MESTRFPGKVLASILGQPMLLRQLDGMRGLTTVQQRPVTLVIALPNTAPNTTELAPLLTRHGYDVRCPDVAPEDVLGRFAAVVRAVRAQTIVRLTGDCPLLDPAIVYDALSWHLDHEVAYTGMAHEWPEGAADIDVIEREVLLAAHAEATDPRDREHVVPWIWRQPARFRQGLLPCPLDYSQHCWSVDTPADLAAVELLMRHYVRPEAGWRAIGTAITQHPDMLASWATSRRRNAAYLAQLGTGTDWRTARYGGP